MESPLSRIEREYVLRNMVEEKPDLLLVTGPECVSVPASGYLMEGDSLSFPPDSILSKDTAVRVYFSHRKRGIFFESALRTKGPGFPRIVRIGDRIFKEPNRARVEEYPQLRLLDDAHPVVANSAPWFPVEPVFPNASLFMDRREQIDVIADKLGLLDFRFHAGRVIEFLTLLTQRSGADRPDRTDGLLLFADENAICMTIPNEVAPAFSRGMRLSFLMEYENRKVRFSASCTGIIPLDATSMIVAAQSSEIHEEDKRFIHERVYRDRYE